MCRQAPVFTWRNKSSKNASLDVVQQILNTFFDRRFAVDHKWGYHPLATTIAESRLKADYRKTFGSLTVQIEVQFGNMSRWYSDIFKFQSAYAGELIDVGVSIVPDSELAKRIDSNVANYERVTKELSAAKNSITLPILVIGLRGQGAKYVELRSNTGFAKLTHLTGKGRADNRYRIVNAHLNGTSLRSIDDGSETGPTPDLDDGEFDESE